jgi:hypothetical protein
MHTVVTFKPQIVAGEAIAFMLYLNGGWCKRVIQVGSGTTTVTALGTKSTPIV